MGGRVLRACMQDHLMVSTCEVGIEPHGVAVQNGCLFHCVSEVEVYCLEVIKRTGLKIKLFFEGSISE